MTDQFFDELKKDLLDGTVQRGHPFRFFSLATVDLDKVPRQRTVVLRKVSDALAFTFYTDRRSKKIIHLNKNNRVSLLFYHPEKLLQVTVEGLAKIITEPHILKRQWSTIQPNARKDYTTEDAPGSRIGNPDNLEYLDGAHHFCIVEVEPFKIELLKLKSPNHLRIRYSREKESWQGEFLVP